jgi:hypothetical protein
MPRVRWRDWFLGTFGIGKPVKPMAKPMTEPVEGQIGVTGRFGNSVWNGILVLPR